MSDTPTVAPVVNFPELQALALEKLAASREAMHASIDAGEALSALLSPEQQRAVWAFIDGPRDAMEMAWNDFLIAEFARHLPGLAPALLAVWHHIMEGNNETHGLCCVPDDDA